MLYYTLRISNIEKFKKHVYKKMTEKHRYFLSLEMGLFLILHQKTFTYHRKQKETSLSRCFSFQRPSDIFQVGRVPRHSRTLGTSKFTFPGWWPVEPGLVQHHGTTELIPRCEVFTTPRQSKVQDLSQNLKILTALIRQHNWLPEQHSPSPGPIKTHHFHFTFSKVCATLRFPEQHFFNQLSCYSCIDVCKKSQTLSKTDTAESYLSPKDACYS